MLCASCLRALLKPQLPRCLWCGKTIPCKVHAGDAKVRAGALYEGIVRELVLMLKHGKYEALGFQIGKALGDVLIKPELDFLVPVPLHRKSKRRYNQAEAIARGLGRRWEIPVWNAAGWALETPTRSGMNAAERLSLSSDAFHVEREVRELRLGLVDDICTTGATLSRLAAACRQKGAVLEGAFVFAQVFGY